MHTVISTFVFFFKQKTAYEMRISDWSSDVCSSDLERAVRPFDEQLYFAGENPRRQYPRRAQVDLERHRIRLPHQREFGRRFDHEPAVASGRDRKSTRMNYSH